MISAPAAGPSGHDQTLLLDGVAVTDPNIARLLKDKLSLLYYAGEPEISDPEFDALWNELLGLEADHPELKSADTPTERISDGVSALFTPVRHEDLMLSPATRAG